MAETKTRPTAVDVQSFLAAVEPPARRADGRTLCAMFERLTGLEPRMWGPSIVGFGSYDYTYESGHSGTAPRTGFSPRKPALVLYVMPGLSSRPDLVARLGKVKTGKSCLYIKRLSDVDIGVLEELVQASLDQMDEKYPR